MDRYFSVVIPLYNKRKHIVRAIESVLSQTYTYFEIIVVNDGSDDGSELEMFRYKHHPNIKLINQENGGVSIARNNGVLAAQYEFVCFLDSDDEWKSCFLEEIANLIVLFPRKNVYSTRHEIIEQNGKSVYPRAYEQEDFRGVIDDFIQCYKASDGIINASSVCVRKPMFLQLGGFPEGQTQGEDVYLWLLYSLHTDIVFSNKICTRYYRNTENRSHERMMSDKLPFQFVHFYSMLQNNKLKGKNFDDNRDDLIKYLRKNALLHVAGLKANNNSKIALSHSMLLSDYNKTAGLLCYAILLIPNKLLKYLKDIRNNARAYQ